MAIPARDLEARDVALPGLHPRGGDAGADLVGYAAELVSQDVALGELEDGGVEEVEVRAADGGSGYLEDDVAGLDDLGLWCVDLCI